ncbi:hypothetical protein EZS27_032833 [termite gut metagenome]|uniref:3-keto-disaccharide hydrolase domain-containing protein n=1 Tax=termite gut metagenome TaxID=433724 RepID=A0A5J4Q586_9ZZZZ
MKESWLITSGQGEILPNEIKYIPHKTKNEMGQEINGVTFISSNIYFKEGEITFKVKLGDIWGMCCIYLDQSLSIFMNCYGKVFGISTSSNETKKWELLSGSVDIGQIDIDKEYSMKILTRGSHVVLYVNDIIAADTTYQLKGDQLVLSFLSSKEISIKDFNVKSNNPEAFVIMQFSDEYNDLYNELTLLQRYYDGFIFLNIV